jgi:hypothetical protein
MPLARYVKMHKLPKKENIKIIGDVREMRQKDVEKVH